MKLFQLLLSLFLAILLCSVPLIRAQDVPAIPTAAPTPPNGAPGAADGPPAPPMVATTVNQPPENTEYPNYAGK